MLPSCTDLFGSDNAHGWNIDIVTRKRSFLQVRPQGLEKRQPADLVFCTLLGPEGPGRHPSDVAWTSGPRAERLTVFGLRRDKHLGDWLEEYRPYFENYTVDASILETSLRTCFT